MKQKKIKLQKFLVKIILINIIFSTTFNNFQWNLPQQNTDYLSEIINNYYNIVNPNPSSTVGTISLENFIIELTNWIMDSSRTEAGYQHYYDSGEYDYFKAFDGVDIFSDFTYGSLGVYFALNYIGIKRNGDIGNNPYWSKLTGYSFPWQSVLETVIHRYGLKNNQDGGKLQSYISSGDIIKIPTIEQAVSRPDFFGTFNYTGLKGVAGLIVSLCYAPIDIGESGDEVNSAANQALLWLCDYNNVLNDGDKLDSQVVKNGNTYKWPIWEGSSTYYPDLTQGAAGVVWSIATTRMYNFNTWADSEARYLIEYGLNWLTDFANSDGNGVQVDDVDGSNSITGTGELRWRFSEGSDSYVSYDKTFGALGIIDALLKGYDCLKNNYSTTVPLYLNAAIEGINYLRNHGSGINTVDMLEELLYLYMLDPSPTHLLWLEETYNLITKNHEYISTIDGLGITSVSSTILDNARFVYCSNEIYYITSNSTYLKDAREVLNFIMRDAMTDSGGIVGDGDGDSWFSDYNARRLFWSGGLSQIVFYLMKCTLGSHRLSLIQDQTEPETASIIFENNEYEIGNSTQVYLMVNDSGSGVEKFIIYINSSEHILNDITHNFPSASGNFNFILNTTEFGDTSNNTIYLKIEDVRGNIKIISKEFDNDNTPPSLSNPSPPPGIVYDNNDVDITIDVEDISSIKNVTLQYYDFKSGVYHYHTLDMTHGSGNQYYTTIPVYSAETQIRYNYTATDKFNNTRTLTTGPFYFGYTVTQGSGDQTGFSVVTIAGSLSHPGIFRDGETVIFTAQPEVFGSYSVNVSIASVMNLNLLDDGIGVDDEAGDGIYSGSWIVPNNPAIDGLRTAVFQHNASGSATENIIIDTIEASYTIITNITIIMFATIDDVVKISVTPSESNMSSIKLNVTDLLSTVDLNDNGENGDQIASDGIYNYLLTIPDLDINKEFYINVTGVDRVGHISNNILTHFNVDTRNTWNIKHRIDIDLEIPDGIKSGESSLVTINLQNLNTTFDIDEFELRFISTDFEYPDGPSVNILLLLGGEITHETIKIQPKQPSRNTKIILGVYENNKLIKTIESSSFKVGLGTGQIIQIVGFVAGIATSIIGLDGIIKDKIKQKQKSMDEETKKLSKKFIFILGIGAVFTSVSSILMSIGGLWEYIAGF